MPVIGNGRTPVFPIHVEDVARQVAGYAGPYPYIDGLLLQVTQRIGSIEVLAALADEPAPTTPIHLALAVRGRRQLRDLAGPPPHRR